MASPLFFLCLIIGIAAGILFNIFLNRKFKKWWFKLLLFLAGSIILAILLSWIGKLVILVPVSGPVGIGGAIGTGIAMGLGYIFFILFGLASYILSFLITSFVRYIRKKLKT